MVYELKENESNSLKGVAEEILGIRYFRELEDFFVPFFDGVEKGDTDDLEMNYEKVYIAFITRRCSCLAYIFLQMFHESYEQSGQEKSISMVYPLTNTKQNDNVVFLTDNSLINKGWDIGQSLLDCASGQEKLSSLPEIIIADDSISYGRAITSVMNQLEEQVLKSIESADDKKMQEAAKLLWAEYKRHHISIQVYAKKDQTNLLKEPYAEIVKSAVTLPHYQWNDLSNRICELINNTNTANAAFVFSQGISDEVGEPDEWTKPEGWQKMDWTYREHRQVVFFYSIPENESQYKAICSIRCVECSVKNSYRLIPFIFLPRLTVAQMEKIEEKIFKRLRDSGKFEDCEIPRDFVSLKKQELEHITLRSRLDFVTMYLSLSALNAFQTEAGIGAGNCQDYDLDKVLWNYSETPLKNKIARQLVDDITNEGKMLFSIEEIEALFNDLDIIPIPFTSIVVKPEREISYQEKINECAEEYLFELGIEIERAAHEAVLSKSRLGEYTLHSLDERRFNPIFVFLQNLAEKVRTLDIKDYSEFELLAVILQMMDAGMMSIASVRIEWEGDEKYEVWQKVRICEQALSTLPRRFLYHADVLLLLERSSWMKKDGIIRYLKRYCDSLHEKNLISDRESEELPEALASFAEVMKQAGQKITYWTVGLKRCFSINKLKGGMREIKLIEDDKTVRQKRLEYKSAIV